VVIILPCSPQLFLAPIFMHIHKPQTMKKKEPVITENKPQTDTGTYNQQPIKNSITDPIKNTANQTEGLNQSKIISNDVFPSDGDNMTQ
jgi:hypothetical protein